MSVAIHAEGLSKQYALGTAQPGGTLRDAVTRTFGRLKGSSAERRAKSTMWALDDVSFDIQHGDIVGIVGRNGSGKSTLLKILTRITDPTRGSATVHGRVGSLLEVGTGFHPELTGRENVFVNGAILGMRRAEIARKFDEIVAFAEVERFIDTPVKHYSSGMQMRLAFAVAAHLEPEILLVDEVLAVGDVEFQRRCLGKMDEVSRHGRTVVFVSHQMNQLRRLCTRCMWLSQGRLVSMGSTADVTNQYEASFIAARPGDSDVSRSAGAEFVGWTLGKPGSAEFVAQTFGPLTVRFRLRIDRSFRNTHHAVVLYDQDGKIVWGTGTDNLDFEPGVYDLSYTLSTLPLKPGPYRWHVNLYEGGWLINSLDCVPEMGIATEPLGHRRDEYAGVLNFPYSLDVRAVADGVADDRPAEALVESVRR